MVVLGEEWVDEGSLVVVDIDWFVFVGGKR